MEESNALKMFRGTPELVGSHHLELGLVDKFADETGLTHQRLNG